MAPKRILIVDDEKLVRWALTKKCTEFGYQTLEAETGPEALQALQNENIDLVLLDVHLPDMSGIEVLEKLKQAGETRSIIMMTADPQLDDVIGESRKITELMKFVYKVASSAATTILIQGESGTGKDLVAKAIHYRSSRAERPFVAINCSAIPETLMEAELLGHEKGAFTDAKAMKKGLFEIADGGTLFLDEIGELSPLLQAKLLRVLEDQVIRRVGGVRDLQVDVRVIAASNRDLEREVRENQFRQDLYYRLAIISIFLPPLRDRKEDVLPLVDYFIGRYNRKFRKNVKGITEESRKLILKYDWPGNVRELKNAVERAMILGEDEELDPEYLPFAVAQQQSAFTAFEHSSGNNGGGAAAKHLPDGRSLPPLHIPEGGTSLEEVERELVDIAMAQANGNQTHAARLLDISRDALRYKLKKFGLIHAEEDEPSNATS